MSVKHILAPIVHQYIHFAHVKMSDGREISGLIPGTFEHARMEAAVQTVFEIRLEHAAAAPSNGAATVTNNSADALTEEFIAEAIYDSFAATLSDWHYRKPWCRDFTLKPPPPGWPTAEAVKLAEIPYEDAPATTREAFLRAARVLLAVWIPAI
jgi:hypothetical protein